jgi:hypothetical protein
MSRTTLFAQILGRSRVPILALLAWVGFVVQGPQSRHVGPDTAQRPASLHHADVVGDSAVHPASGHLSLGDQTVGERLPRTRAPRSLGRDGPRVGDAAVAPPPASRPATPGSPGASAAAMYAEAALLRAGRLSAPTTAPPVSPF